MEQTVHAQASYYSGIATAGLVIAVIALIIIIGLLIAFFVERNLFLYPSYRIVPATISSGNTTLTSGAGDTVLILTQPSPQLNTYGIVINASSSNNVKGQFFYVFYPKSSANTNPVTLTLAGQGAVTIDTTTFKLSPGQTGIYFVDATNAFKFMGTTTVGTT